MSQGSKFFQLHALLAEIWRNRMLAPPLEGWRLHLGEILDPPLDMVIGNVVSTLN